MKKNNLSQSSSFTTLSFILWALSSLLHAENSTNFIDTSSLSSFSTEQVLHMLLQWSLVISGAFVFTCLITHYQLSKAINIGLIGFVTAAVTFVEFILAVEHIKTGNSMTFLLSTHSWMLSKLLFLSFLAFGTLTALKYIKFHEKIPQFMLTSFITIIVICTAIMLARDSLIPSNNTETVLTIALIIIECLCIGLLFLQRIINRYKIIDALIFVCCLETVIALYNFPLLSTSFFSWSMLFMLQLSNFALLVGAFIDFLNLKDSYTHNNMLSSPESNIVSIRADRTNRFDFIYSHDLQEPTRTINSFAQLLKEHIGRKKLLDDRTEKYLSSITESSERIKLLVDDILSFVKVENKQPDLQTINLNKFFKMTIEPQLPSNHKLSFFSLHPIQADAELFETLAIHLISNSFKYNRSEEPEVKISTTTVKNAVQINISDNGIGIPLKYRKKLFQLFTRLHSYNFFPGTGLGLSIVKSVVEKHNGKIWIDHKNDSKGTTFCIELPLIEAHINS